MYRIVFFAQVSEELKKGFCLLDSIKSYHRKKIKEYKCNIPRFSYRIFFILNFASFDIFD